jgi:hypothetical protein
MPSGMPLTCPLPAVSTYRAYPTLIQRRPVERQAKPELVSCTPGQAWAGRMRCNAGLHRHAPECRTPNTWQVDLWPAGETERAIAPVAVPSAVHGDADAHAVE